MARKLRSLAYWLDPSLRRGFCDTEQYGIIMADLENRIVKDKLYLNPSISIDSLAPMLGLTRSYLARVLKYNGLTFSTYINNFRLRYAASLIARNTSMDMTEVAETSGFTNLRSFNYFVTKRYGISQAQFRQRISQLLSALQEGQTRQPCRKAG